MSAWLVTKGHIDCIVQSLVVEGIIQLDEADAVGRELWLENYRSLNARYGDHIPNKLKYTFDGVEAPLDPEVVFKQLHCYEYQTCEHAGYERSRARSWVHQLSESLGKDWEQDRMHPDAPWGIESIGEAIAR